MITDKQVEAARDAGEFVLVPRELTTEMLDASESAAWATKDQLGPNADFDKFMHYFVQAQWRAALQAAPKYTAPSSAKPADYPNPGAHTPLRPAVTEQPPAAPGVVSDAPKKWPGLKDLEYVIERLRETCSFRDEEGDVTDGLESLLNAIKAAQPSAPGVVTDAMVQRFLAWELLTDARAQAGGPGRVNAAEARTLLHHVLFGIAAAQPSADDAPTFRHLKRGSVVRLLGEGHAQTASVIRDMDVVMIYREQDGELWIRPSAEFNDGRFERIAEAAPPADARDAEDARPIPTPDEARNGWYVAFGAHGVDLLTLSSDGSYRGLGNIDDYADIVRSAARTLRAFVGVTDPIADAWPECSGDPACCPENEGYGCCKPNPADRAMGGE